MKDEVRKVATIASLRSHSDESETHCRQLPACLLVRAGRLYELEKKAARKTINRWRIIGPGLEVDHRTTDRQTYSG